MAEMNWRKRAGVLLSILVLTLMDLSINKARARADQVLRA